MDILTESKLLELALVDHQSALVLADHIEGNGDLDKADLIRKTLGSEEICIHFNENITLRQIDEFYLVRSYSLREIGSQLIDLNEVRANLFLPALRECKTDLDDLILWPSLCEAEIWRHRGTRYVMAIRKSTGETVINGIEFSKEESVELEKRLVGREIPEITLLNWKRIQEIV